MKTKIAYIRVDDRKFTTLIDNIKTSINNIICKISVEHIKNGVLILIPINCISEGDNIQKKRELINKRIDEIVQQYEITHIVMDNQISNYIKLGTIKCNILNGKILMLKLVSNILEYIFGIMGTNMQLEDIFVTVNEYNKKNIELIYQLSENFRSVNIVTENVRKYRIVESRLEEDSKLITVLNNKRKSLKNAKFIINIDFSNLNIGKYNVNSNAIVLNLADEKISKIKNFNGVIVNDFSILLNEDIDLYVNEFFGNIDKKLFIESMIILKENKMLKYIEDNNFIKLKEIYGVRGKITQQDFKRISHYSY